MSGVNFPPPNHSSSVQSNSPASPTSSSNPSETPSGPKKVPSEVFLAKTAATAQAHQIPRSPIKNATAQKGVSSPFSKKLQLTNQSQMKIAPCAKKSMQRAQLTNPSQVSKLSKQKVSSSGKPSLPATQFGKTVRGSFVAAGARTRIGPCGNRRIGSADLSKTGTKRKLSATHFDASSEADSTQGAATDLFERRVSKRQR